MSELIEDWSKHTTLFHVAILGLMLQIGIGEKGNSLSASVEVQLFEIDKIGCRQNGRVAGSEAKQSEIFPSFPSVTCGAQRSTRDRVGEPYAMPNRVILTYVIVCSLSHFIHHPLQLPVFNSEGSFERVYWNIFETPE